MSFAPHPEFRSSKYLPYLVRSDAFPSKLSELKSVIVIAIDFYKSTLYLDRCQFFSDERNKYPDNLDY